MQDSSGLELRTVNTIGLMGGGHLDVRIEEERHE